MNFLSAFGKGIQRSMLMCSVVLITLTMFSSCGIQRVGFPTDETHPPADPSIEDPTGATPGRKGPANTLYLEAKASMAQGNNHRAELAIERALRVEPGNPYYWYTMGKIKYRQGAYEEAVQFCLKSKSLAGRNGKLVRANDILIGKARKDSSRL